MAVLQVYLYSNQLAERGVRKMEKKNVVFTKDGARVGVKELKAEDYADKTQRYGSVINPRKLSPRPRILLTSTRAFMNTWNAAHDGEGGKKR